MVIYVEYLLIDNFFLTYLICDLTYALTGRKKSKKRSIIASIIATIVAFSYPFVVTLTAVSYAIKGVLWLILGLILFIKKQNYFISSLVFLLVTALVGGVLTLVCTLITPSYDVMSGKVNFSFPIGVVVLVGYAVCFIVKRLHASFYRRKNEESNVCSVKVGLYGKTFSLKGFTDTGNRLMDSNSGLPVVVVKASAIIQAFSPSTFAELIEKGRSNCISYTTVTGGINKIMLIYPDFFKIGIKEKDVDVAMGVSFSGFYGDYDVILHPSLG